MTARCILTVSKLPDRKGWWVLHALLQMQYPSQAIAIMMARNLAYSHHSGGGLSQVVIRGRDGRIKREWTYGADPRRTKG